MRIRLVYMRTPTDGFAIDELFDVDVLPRIGEQVFLPLGHLDTIKKEEPSLDLGALGVTRRYDVVGIEHRWDELSQTPTVKISKMNNPAFGPAGDVAIRPGR